MGRFGESLFSSKAATFIATVTVYELNQVPLVNANFKLKWKFKQACTGILEEVEESSTARKFLNPLNSLAKNYDHTRQDSDDSTHYQVNDYPNVLSPPMSPSQDTRTPNPDRTPSQLPFNGFTSPFGTPIASPGTSHEFPSSPRGNTTDEFGGKLRNRSNGISLSEPILSTGTLRAEPKGMTSLVGLRNYTATFQREIHCSVAIPVRISNSSTKYELQPSPLRLAIRQEITEETGKVVEIKTGEVLLDLSQFVDGKGITRRYLLRDCKTNATLRVNVKMEWVTGEKNYTLPTLKSGQVEASILLSATGTSTGSPNSTKARKNYSPSTTGIARTNSSGSFSQRSSPSTKSIESPDSKRTGWRPPSSTTSHAPLYQTNSNSNLEPSAVDIIDSIFNRTTSNKSLFGFTAAPNTYQNENGRNRGTSAAGGRGGRLRANTTPMLVVPPLNPSPNTYDRMSVDGRRSVKWSDHHEAPVPSTRSKAVKTSIRASSSSQSLGRVNESGEKLKTGGIQFADSWA